MLLQLLVGLFVSALNIAIHAVITVLTIRIARATALKPATQPWRHLVAVMMATSLVLMTAHTAEVFVWSVAYANRECGS